MFVFVAHLSRFKILIDSCALSLTQARLSNGV